MSSGQAPVDLNGKPALSAYDPTGHQIVAIEAVGITTDSTTGIAHGTLNVNASMNASSLSINDPTVTTQKMSVDASGNASVKVGTNFSATATLSNVASSASTTQILAANSSRRGMMIYNDSTSVLYLSFAATASTSSYSLQLAANSFYEMPVPIYTGVISGIWASANGFTRVTELI